MESSSGLMKVCQVTFARRSLFVSTYLIDNYGDNEEILVALSRNMSSFGWTWSVVPYYEKEIKALTEFQSHKSVNVREWADRRIRYLDDSIKAERIRDEETAWGIR